MIIHLNLHAAETFPVRLYKEPKRNQEISLKVSNGTSPVTVKILSHDSFSCEEQGEHGHTFFADQYLTFELNVDDIKALVAKVEIYVLGECLGVSYLTSLHFATGGVSGEFVVPLLYPSTSELSAEIKFHYLLISHWRGHKVLDAPCRTLSTCKEEFLLIGHRGCGVTTERRAVVLENTTPSFSAAASEGAAFVELDVLLTKDEIPVVFHDHDATLYAEHKDGSLDGLTVRVHDRTLGDLQSRKMRYARPSSDLEYNNVSYATLFPTLQQVLNDTPSSLGLFVEVKFPQQEKESKDWETSGYFDKDVVVDRILDVVMNYPGDRPIMFCSFDPEVCILLQCKQHRFPVVFITSGENAVWSEPMDVRCRTRKFALNFALMNDLLGVSFYGDPALQEGEEFSCIVSTLKSFNKHAFTWGPCNSVKAKVELQKTLRVTGVISDNLENLSTDINNNNNGDNSNGGDGENY